MFSVILTKNTDSGKEAYYFMGGIMKHIKGMTLINNPIINSYKRLVPGYNAPVNISWSRKNRTPLMRITSSGAIGPRIVLRSPDWCQQPISCYGSLSGMWTGRN